MGRVVGGPLTVVWFSFGVICESLTWFYEFSWWCSVVCARLLYFVRRILLATLRCVCALHFTSLTVSLCLSLRTARLCMPCSFQQLCTPELRFAQAPLFSSYRLQQLFLQVFWRVGQLLILLGAPVSQFSNFRGSVGPSPYSIVLFFSHSTEEGGLCPPQHFILVFYLWL